MNETNRVDVQTAAENSGTEDEREFTISSRCWHASDIRATDHAIHDEHGQSVVVFGDSWDGRHPHDPRRSQQTDDDDELELDSGFIVTFKKWYV